MNGIPALIDQKHEREFHLPLTDTARACVGCESTAFPQKRGMPKGLRAAVDVQVREMAQCFQITDHGRMHTCDRNLFWDGECP